MNIYKMASSIAIGNIISFLNSCVEQQKPVDRSPDIISMVVDIYGSKDIFVNEYKNLLADRLLAQLDFDPSRELANLEHLKLRFDESMLHTCDVMLKDITDSKRTNCHIHSVLASNASNCTYCTSYLRRQPLIIIRSLLIFVVASCLYSTTFSIICIDFIIAILATIQINLHPRATRRIQRSIRYFYQTIRGIQRKSVACLAIKSWPRRCRNRIRQQTDGPKSVNNSSAHHLRFSRAVKVAFGGAQPKIMCANISGTQANRFLDNETCD